MPWYSSGGVDLHVGHVLDVLAGLPAGSAQVCVTSPPFYGLRNYGTEPQVWGSPDCDHDWAESIREQHQPNVSASSTLNPCPAKDNRIERGHGQITQATCRRSGCWRGELGSEPTPQLYVEHIVEVFRAVRRVLHDSGTCWVNLGDSYSGSGKGPTGHNGIGDQGQRQGFVDQRSDVPGLGPKQLMMMPARVAMALQADGWVLRQQIIWAKPNPMPESVTDRCTTSHEYLYLLAKNPRYYFDAEAIKEPNTEGSRARFGENGALSGPGKYAGMDGQSAGAARAYMDAVTMNGRNRRSVWTIATEAFSAARLRRGAVGDSDRTVSPTCPIHGVQASQVDVVADGALQDASPSGDNLRIDNRLAPESLPAPLSTSESQAVARLGDPSANDHSSQTHRTDAVSGQRDKGGVESPLHTGYMAPLPFEYATDSHTSENNTAEDGASDGWGSYLAAQSGNRTAYKCTCTIIDHFAVFPRALVTPCVLAGSRQGDTVLDPFCGSGTSLWVARQHFRRAIGVELNPEYAALAADRLKQSVLPFVECGG